MQIKDTEIRKYHFFKHLNKENTVKWMVEYCVVTARSDHF